MVFLPIIRDANDALGILHKFERRRGGGGRGGGSKGGGSKGSKGGKGSGSKGSKSYGKGSRGTAVGGFAFGAGLGTAHPYAWGGGSARTIHNNGPFAGRLSGNGTRDQIFGTSRYGSGYPYGGSGDVSGRPFPFVFWPVPIATGYFGADTYINYANSVRPGGDIKYLFVKSSLATTSETYRLVGDRSSLTPVLNALVSNCSVASASPADFDPSSSKPMEIIQWYRASSFALALDGYTNLASSPANMSLASGPLPPSADIPLPSGLNATFLACVNATIGASLPLMAPPKPGFSAGKIAGIVIASIGGAFFLALLVIWFIRRRRQDRVRSRQDEIANERAKAKNGPGKKTMDGPGKKGGKLVPALVFRLPGAKRKGTKEVYDSVPQSERALCETPPLAEKNPAPDSTTPTVVAMPTSGAASADKSDDGSVAAVTMPVPEKMPPPEKSGSGTS